MTSNDVTSVEISRVLKRNGIPQESKAYWQGIIPSLNTIKGMSAIAVEDKGKMRWLLVLGKPPEPNVSAFTLQELKNYLKNFMATNKTGKEYPEIKKNDKLYVCSIGEKKDLFVGTNEVAVFAEAVIYITKL